MGACMGSISTKQCAGCGCEFPATREFFGSTPNGGLRGKCRKCMARHTAAYDAANPGMAELRRIKRALRQSSAGPRLLDEWVQELRNRQRDKCGYCLRSLDGGGHVDHMTPLAKGGRNSKDNIVIACKQCNLEKHAKTAGEYFAWRETRGLRVFRTSYAYRVTVSPKGSSS